MRFQTGHAATRWGAAPIGIYGRRGTQRRHAWESSDLKAAQEQSCQPVFVSALCPVAKRPHSDFFENLFKRYKSLMLSAAFWVKRLSFDASKSVYRLEWTRVQFFLAMCLALVKQRERERESESSTVNPIRPQLPWHCPLLFRARYGQNHVRCYWATVIRVVWEDCAALHWKNWYDSFLTVADSQLKVPK